MRAPLVLLLFLLAGCSESSPDDDASTVPPVDPGDPSDPDLIVRLVPTNVTVEWATVFSETQVAGFITSSAQCEELTASYAMLGGLIVATWDAPNAASEQLRVVVEGATQELAMEEGPSPLEVRFEAPESTEVVRVDVGTVAPVGAANDLQVEFAATLTLEAQGSVETSQVNTCPG